MAIDGIYMKDSKITTTTAIQGKDASQLTMDDFFNLLVAQMTNQDMMNPVNDTEFIAQMAQFSSLQGIQSIQQNQTASYATSYVGKWVTIANTKEDGTLETITGLVEGVNFYEGSPKVYVNGKAYELYTVMEVSGAAGVGTLNEASSYIGKKVMLSYIDEFKETKEVIGTVTAVSLKDNKPHLVVNGTEYPIAYLKSVVEDIVTPASSPSETTTASATVAASETAATTTPRWDVPGPPSEDSRKEVNDMGKSDD